MGATCCKKDVLDDEVNGKNGIEVNLGMKLDGMKQKIRNSADVKTSAKIEDNYAEDGIYGSKGFETHSDHNEQMDYVYSTPRKQKIEITPAKKIDVNDIEG